MKLTMILPAAIAVSMLAACNNGSEGAEMASTTTVDGHQHRYACPMHPEVTGKEGDTCPKCGMKLEHSDAPPDASGTYFMQYASAPATIEPQQEVTLSFTPKKKGAEGEQVALDIEHEKKIHLILVSDDLSWFDHIHPEYNADGSYTVKTSFPAGGSYKAFADYKPTGGSHVVDKIDVQVSGTPAPPKAFPAQKLAGTSGGYTLALQPAGTGIVTGTPLHIKGVLTKDGKQVDASSLDNYLGAKGHFVLISLNEKEYLHVHPEVEGGKFDLHTTIDKPGTYRGWMQFMGDGTIQTVDFTWVVSQGTSEAATATDHSGH